jgi:hypothetical protein
MASKEFGVQLRELTEVQQGWHSVSERMAEMGADLGRIRSVLARAAATDVTSSHAGGTAGMEAAVEVARGVRDIESQVASLLVTKARLTRDIAGDARKIKAVVAEYEAVDREVARQLKKAASARVPSAPPVGRGSGGGGTALDGTGSHGHAHGHAHHGGVASAAHGGAHGTGVKDRGAGGWATHTDSRGWDGWSPSGRRHPRNGEGGGVLAEPRLAGVGAERRAIVGRAMERARHRLGYSQSSVTNGYRVDCSGLVSDAWGLPGPGLNTWELMSPEVSHLVEKDDLRPGDALISGDHTLIFGGWADTARTSYVGIEDCGSRGCVAHVIPYPYYPGSGPYRPYRRNGVR